MLFSWKGITCQSFFQSISICSIPMIWGITGSYEIHLVRVIEDYNKESPYLVEASGQTPPEDVGGVGGFVNFREIMLNPSHPEYEERKVFPITTQWKRHSVLAGLTALLRN